MKRYFFIFIALMLLFSCRKKTTDVPPVITVSSPTHNQSFTVPDSVRIGVLVSDNNVVKTISISLHQYNTDKKVLQSLNFSPNQKEYKVNAFFPLNDIYLEGGNYYFRITASDGVLSSTEYVNVFIGEAPQMFTGAYIFSQSGNNLKVDYMNTQYAVSPFATYASDYGHSAGNLYGQYLHSMGKNSGKLVALRVSDAQEAWSVPFGASFPTLFFEKMHYANKLLYVGFSEGMIRAYNTNGGVERAFLSAQGFKPSHILYAGEHLITEQKQIVGQGSKIAAYYTFSSALRQELSMQGSVAALFEINANEILVVANEGVNSRIWVYNIAHNQLYSQKTISGKTCKSAVYVGNDTYLLGLGNDVQSYHLPGNTLLTYLSGVAADDMQYEAYSNRLYLVSGTQVRVYDYSAVSLLHTHTNATTIRAVQLMYNRE